MLPLENKANKKITVVILCAGEGVRLEDFVKEIPKPLIKIKSIGNIPILQYTLQNLKKFAIDHIIIVKGHLGKKIDEFIDSFIQSNHDLEGKMSLIDASSRYKLGPLYSFLSITSDKNLLKKNIYLVIPGDTIFQFSLLDDIMNLISKNLTIAQKFPIVFYRKINIDFLKNNHQEASKKTLKTISIVEIVERHTKKLLKKIYQQDIIKFSDIENINQIVPIFMFPYKFITKIIKIEKKASVKTIREIINFAIEQGSKIYVEEVESKYGFYDIDYKSDLIDVIKLKEE